MYFHSALGRQRATDMHALQHGGCGMYVRSGEREFCPVHPMIQAALIFPAANYQSVRSLS